MIDTRLSNFLHKRGIVKYSTETYRECTQEEVLENTQRQLRQKEKECDELKDQCLALRLENDSLRYCPRRDFAQKRNPEEAL